MPVNDLAYSSDLGSHSRCIALLRLRRIERRRGRMTLLVQECISREEPLLSFEDAFSHTNWPLRNAAC